MFQPKIMHYSLLIIHYSLIICVGRRRPRRPVLQRNHPKELLIIHYSLNVCERGIPNGTYA